MTAAEAQAEQEAERAKQLSETGIADYEPEISGSEPAAVRQEPEATPVASAIQRCPVKNSAGQQCLYEVHAEAYAHLFDEKPAAPRLAVTPQNIAESGKRIPVGRQTAFTWWCGRCDNAQQLTDTAVCRKCGAVPELRV